MWSAVRPLTGWLLALLGAVALFLAWYGVSGTPVLAKQVPYVVSGGLTGVALVVLAAAFLATEDVRRQLTSLQDVERKVDDLYRLLTEDQEEAGGPVVAVAGGTSYHLPHCRLVAGKASALPLEPAEVARRHLGPCRLCDPPALRTA